MVFGFFLLNSFYWIYLAVLEVMTVSVFLVLWQLFSAGNLFELSFTPLQSFVSSISPLSVIEIIEDLNGHSKL